MGMCYPGRGQAQAYMHNSSLQCLLQLGHLHATEHLDSFGIADVPCECLTALHLHLARAATQQHLSSHRHCKDALPWSLLQVSTTQVQPQPQPHTTTPAVEQPTPKV